MFIVELEENCWIADWEGDPGRTVVKENAKTFKTEKEAEKTLKKALKYRDFQNSKLIKI